MLNKLTQTFRRLKCKIQQTPKICGELWTKFNQERGILVCWSIHIIYLMVSTVGALPYRVVKFENGYRKFSPVKGLRKWIVNGIYTNMVLRPAFYALLPLSSELKLAVGGNLTADFLIWVLSLQFATVPAIFCYKFARNSEDIALIYNSLGQIMRSASRKYFKGKHIFELVKIHWAVVLVLTLTSGATVLIPILSVVTFLALKDTPVYFWYHVAGTYWHIQEDATFRIVIHCICYIDTWLYLMYLSWVMTTLMILMGEGIIGCTILLKSLRSVRPKKITWREKYKLHAQLEIILTVYNNWVGFAAPLTVAAGYLFSVCSIVTLMKVDLEMGFPKPTIIPFFIIFGAGGAFGGAMIIKYAEELRANSMGLLKEVEATITACSFLELRRKFRTTFYPTGRTLRRRPTGVRLGNFMFIENGLSSSYLMQIQDKTISLFFIVDLKAHPIWLWET